MISNTKIERFKRIIKCTDVKSVQGKYSDGWHISSPIGGVVLFKQKSVLADLPFEIAEMHPKLKNLYNKLQSKSISEMYPFDLRKCKRVMRDLGYRGKEKQYKHYLFRPLVDNSWYRWALLEALVSLIVDKDSTYVVKLDSRVLGFKSKNGFALVLGTTINTSPRDKIYATLEEVVLK